MTPNNTDEQIRHVFDEWHRDVKDQHAEGLDDRSPRRAGLSELVQESPGKRRDDAAACGLPGGGARG
jgi:hypothetical protein